MSLSKSSKMLNYINCRMRVTIQDGRQLVGKFMAFDRHMNLVLGDTEEFRRLPPKKGSGASGASKPASTPDEREDRRTLGLILLRGEEVVSMTVEGPPQHDDSRVKGPGAAAPGPGIARPAGRGMLPTVAAAPTAAHAQPGLAGPARGVGGPAPSVMQPQMSRPPTVSAGPVTYPPPPRPMPGVRPGMMPTQIMPGAAPQFRPGMPPPPAGGAPGFGNRPMMMMRPGMPPAGPPPPPRPGMPMPPGGAAVPGQRPAVFPPPAGRPPVQQPPPSQ